jgi:hypothetical protein
MISASVSSSTPVPLFFESKKIEAVAFVLDVAIVMHKKRQRREGPRRRDQAWAGVCHCDLGKSR